VSDGLDVHGWLVHRRFATVASRTPEATALLEDDRPTTFGDLAQCTRALVARLHALSLPHASRIAILAAEHATTIAAILAVLEYGGIYVPIDGATPAPRARVMLDAIGVVAIISDVGSAPRARELARDRHLVVMSADDVVDEIPATTPHRGADPDAPCSVYFTSGSTGAPRAILGRVAGIDHHIAWEIAALALDAGVRGAIIHAPSYDAYLPDVFVPMCAGGIACAPPHRGVLGEPAMLAKWLRRAGITLLHCTPSVFRDLVACPDARGLAIEHVVWAGEVVRASDIVLARSCFGDQVAMWNLYGPTEATLVKFHHRIRDDDGVNGPVPIGVPMPGVTMHLLAEDGSACADGELGQIAIQSRFASFGYAGEPELTAKKFLVAPDGSGETLYLTGDYGRRSADGLLEFHGRRDRQIKVLGARVDLDEVESLIAQCEGVKEVAVVADAANTASFAFVVLGHRTIADVRRDIVARVAPATRLARVRAVDALPRTTTGKIDRAALAANLED
jgi:amino acid adenylation domain-containing protein